MALSVLATGDSLITQRLHKKDKNCLALKSIFDSHDACFTNFELLVHDFEVSPSAVSGGTWVAAPPAIITDLQWLGFNLFAAATNHSLDWGSEGLLTTMRHLEAANCVHAGMGRTLAEASRPKFLDAAEGRIALISVCSTAKDWHIAGDPRADVLGRPGINVLRFSAVHYLPEEDIQTLKALIAKTDANARRLQLERDGYAKSAEGVAVESVRFEVGAAGTITSCNKKDLARICGAISDARRQADVVLVSHHTHEFKGDGKDVPADFAREFARACIDNGAHAYLGHGPHIPRGIEIYKSRPLFHGLGDFFLQYESTPRQPAEFFDLYDLGPDATPTDGFEARTANGTRGHAVDPRLFETVMAAFKVENDKVQQIELIPITLGFGKPRSRKGRPELASKEDAARILQDMQALSAPFGTTIAIENGRGYIECD